MCTGLPGSLTDNRTYMVYSTNGAPAFKYSRPKISQAALLTSFFQLYRVFLCITTCSPCRPPLCNRACIISKGRSSIHEAMPCMHIQDNRCRPRHGNKRGWFPTHRILCHPIVVAPLPDPGDQTTCLVRLPVGYILCTSHGCEDADAPIHYLRAPLSASKAWSRTTRL